MSFNDKITGMLKKTKGSKRGFSTAVSHNDAVDFFLGSGLQSRGEVRNGLEHDAVSACLVVSAPERLLNHVPLHLYARRRDWHHLQPTHAFARGCGNNCKRFEATAPNERDIFLLELVRIDPL